MYRNSSNTISFGYKRMVLEFVFLCICNLTNLKKCVRIFTSIISLFRSRSFRHDNNHIWNSFNTSVSCLEFFVRIWRCLNLAIPFVLDTVHLCLFRMKMNSSKTIFFSMVFHMNNKKIGYCFVCKKCYFQYKLSFSIDKLWGWEK